MTDKDATRLRVNFRQVVGRTGLPCASSEMIDDLLSEQPGKVRQEMLMGVSLRRTQSENGLGLMFPT